MARRDILALPELAHDDVLRAMTRALLLSSILAGCGAAPVEPADGPAPGGSERSAGTENGVAPLPTELPGLALDPARALRSLDPAERALFIGWLLATAPQREERCADGLLARVGYRPDITEEEMLPPRALDRLPACSSLTVLEFGGCQLVGATFAPCDREHALRTWTPGGACGAVAACLEAAIAADGG